MNRWSGSGKTIRVGLQAVHGLSQRTIDRLLLERKNRGEFSDSVDFWNRVLPADDEARALIHAGAMDSITLLMNRTGLLWQLASFQRGRSQALVNSLFPVRLPNPPPLKPPDLQSKLLREYEVLGFLCHYHPMVLAGRVSQGLVKMADVPRNVGRRIRCAGWLLSGKLISTKTGEVMEFLTFEDDTGIQETTFFPEVYKRSAHLLQSGRAYILTGIVEEDYGAVTLTVEQVSVLRGGGGGSRL